ncbi:hypothetical protein B0H10DRAFT_1727024, partial [Mycena sp. CBHHK59/15]
MTANPLPAALFDGLLLKALDVLELTQKPEGAVTPQAKQAILKATKEFKDALKQAKDLVFNLPGGGLVIKDQADVIEMLIGIRDRKQQQLSQFSQRTVEATSTSRADRRMEIDSMAST